MGLGGMSVRSMREGCVKKGVGLGSMGNGVCPWVRVRVNVEEVCMGFEVGVSLGSLWEVCEGGRGLHLHMR